MSWLAVNVRYGGISADLVGPISTLFCDYVVNTDSPITLASKDFSNWIKHYLSFWCLTPITICGTNAMRSLRWEKSCCSLHLIPITKVLILDIIISCAKFLKWYFETNLLWVKIWFSGCFTAQWIHTQGHKGHGCNYPKAVHLSKSYNKLTMFQSKAYLYSSDDL